MNPYRNQIGSRITREVREVRFLSRTVQTFGVELMGELNEELFLRDHRAAQASAGVKRIDISDEDALKAVRQAHGRTPRNKRNNTWYRWSFLLFYHIAHGYSGLVTDDAWECEIVDCFADAEDSRKIHFTLKPLRLINQTRIFAYYREDAGCWDVRVYEDASPKRPKRYPRCTLRGNAYRDEKWTYHFNEFVVDDLPVVRELMFKIPIKADKVKVEKPETRVEKPKKKKRRWTRMEKSFDQLYNLLPALPQAV